MKLPNSNLLFGGKAPVEFMKDGGIDQCLVFGACSTLDAAGGIESTKQPRRTKEYESAYSAPLPPCRDFGHDCIA